MCRAAINPALPSSTFTCSGLRNFPRKRTWYRDGSPQAGGRGGANSFIHVLRKGDFGTPFKGAPDCREEFESSGVIISSSE